MTVGFVVVDLLDPEAVDLCRGSLPEMEAAPSRDARMEASDPWRDVMEAWSRSGMETTQRRSGLVGGDEIEERDAMVGSIKMDRYTTVY